MGFDAEAMFVAEAMFYRYENVLGGNTCLLIKKLR